MKKIELPQFSPCEVWFGFIILEAALVLSMACHQYYSEKKAEENNTNTIEGHSFDTFENEEENTILEEQDTNIGEIGELIPKSDISQVDEECQWEDDYIAATFDMDPVIKEDVKCYCLIK